MPSLIEILKAVSEISSKKYVLLACHHILQLTAILDHMINSHLKAYVSGFEEMYTVLYIRVKRTNECPNIRSKVREQTNKLSNQVWDREVMQVNVLVHCTTLVWTYLATDVKIHLYRLQKCAKTSTPSGRGATLYAV